METAVSDEVLHSGKTTEEMALDAGATKILEKDQAQDVQRAEENNPANPTGNEQIKTMSVKPRIKMLIKKAGFNNTVFGFVFINSVCITDRTRDDPMVRKAKLLYPEIEISDYSDPKDSV